MRASAEQDAIAKKPSTAEQSPIAAPLLRSVVLCDLVDSTALTQRLGDRDSAEITRRADRRVRNLLADHGGREIDKTDGFLLLFERPVQAVGFALDYQRALRELSSQTGVALRARVGIHVGEVVLWHNAEEDVARGAKPLELEGLVKPVASRLMGLALPGQILLSDVAYALALRACDELPGERRLQWRSHGRYRFKGVAETMAVYEVGEKGFAPLHRPAYSSKAHREVPWWRRPAALIVEGALLLAAAAIPVWISLRSPPAIAFAQRDWVVIGDLNNLTDEPGFNDSLQTAFRLGLEQSSYVNVLSELKVRDTLALMQRDPDKTPVDRAIGSEVAIRDGARALILPTVTEIGGHVRISVEVIDPHSQETVYTESADGIGAESALESMDKVERALRLRLGEALVSVRASGPPLPQVTTGNLDALRAYTLGDTEYRLGHWGQAQVLYDQAISIDPNFALAYLARADLHIGAWNTAAAKEDLQRVEAMRAHLPPREALRADAMAAMLGPPAEGLTKYRLLSQMYPDSYAAHYNYALIAWNDCNRFGDAAAELRKGLSPQNADNGAFYYFLGVLQLAEEDYAQAMDSLRKAQSLHGEGLGLVLVEAAEIRRRFDEAGKALAKSHASGVEGNDLGRKLTAITLQADRGHWTAALAAAADARKLAESKNAYYGRLYRMTQLSLESFSLEKAKFSGELRKFVDGEIAALKDNNEVNHHNAQFHLLVAAYLAARRGAPALADAAVTAATEAGGIEQFPNLVNLQVVALAERARKRGRPKDAITRLRSQINGSELYLTHVALLDALVDAGEKNSALQQARWLAEHRGRAFEEANQSQQLQPFNAVESDLALLRQVELEIELGNPDRANKDRREFLAAWPSADKLAFVAPRLRASERR